MGYRENREMEKDFDAWNEEKKIRDQEERIVFFREREVWWCAVGINIGREQNGKDKQFQRPVLIIKRINTEMFLGIPLTSRFHKNSYIEKITHNKRSSYAVELNRLIELEMEGSVG
jgi:mRNA interferase MazF